MKWSIIILSVPSRKNLLVRLLNRLVPQIEGLPVEVVLVVDDDTQVLLKGSPQIRTVRSESPMVVDKRNLGIQEAVGEYLSFIDDDDDVADSYVASLLPLMDGKVDYIGFRLQMYEDGSPKEPTFHDFAYSGWSEGPVQGDHGFGYYRDVSHLNPIRRSIALAHPFDGPSYAEDRRWSVEVRPEVKETAYVPDIMYFYYFSIDHSMFSSMFKYRFHEHKDLWRQVPVDDWGYVSSEEMLSHPDAEITWMLDQARERRNTGWRNQNGQWRRVLTDDIKDTTIMDFGCGVGLESKQLMEQGNTVYAADINWSSALVAQRYSGAIPVEVTGEYPFWQDLQFQVFYANGVMHHIPYPRDIVERALECGATDFRFMLYTDKAWKDKTGVEAGRADDEYREKFAEAMDFPGVYVDWYNAEKVERTFEGLLRLDFWTLITPAYAAVRMSNA